MLKSSMLLDREYPHDMERGIYPVLDCILNVAHFYSDHICVPHIASYDEYPETPSFSRIMFVTTESPDYRRRKQNVNHSNEIGILNHSQLFCML